ncbi:hypothetical protein KII95_07000 [Leuconostoc gelidum subsp. aenigmaticum]|uniref:hypothetical protein n=1 Tax=Leuconostoc gelidum TaxID=1244 RepID=UPI001C7D7EB4|nr:hypothetical protein [Leuconostoc gelidum]MBZ6003762.1 hypothetical protein [Leuconostoc gelidum subsp. aenigmaticum]MBZ6010114.1 hypothetical protein [Leuconostoc gelidum subsp. aenigmaticum]
MNKAAIVATGILAVGMIVGPLTSVNADDTLNGTTNVTSEVTRGDLSLKVADSVDFGKQVLSPVVDFGTKGIDYTVTNYTGELDGYTISVKADADVSERSFKVGDVSNASATDATAVTVAAEDDQNGDKLGTADSALSYAGLKTIGKYNTELTWTLTQGTPEQFAE